MGNEKLWVEWPNPKDGYELQPLYQKCKKYMKMHGIKKCYVILSLNYWLLLYQYQYFFGLAVIFPLSKTFPQIIYQAKIGHMKFSSDSN